MLGPDDDLPSLIQRKDHLGVLRYVRAHQLRQPHLVLQHGTALLGSQFKGGGSLSEEVRCAALEQICLAAADVGDHDQATACLEQLKLTGAVPAESARFRRLVARCLEAAGNMEKAEAIYDVLLKENPANLLALQRKYCIVRAQKKEPHVVLEALQDYLSQNMADVAAWYEMAKLRMSLADYKGAAYALEQVILGSPLEPPVHTLLAEVYATLGGLDNLLMARRHMAQALELDPSYTRAQFGLVTVANQYLEEAETASKKDFDEHEKAVAQELVRYGAAQVLKTYKGTQMLAAVKQVMDDYTENL
eukprot:Nitzschia sp. Nitz4//scaffold207_size38617//24242//25156//NITZ4_007679-RA/size38617-processed-gene-0.34-mRNA-1//1//CDS//3329541617//5561//frame0